MQPRDKVIFHAHAVPTWNARRLMDARPRCTLHQLPSACRPSLFAGD